MPTAQRKQWIPSRRAAEAQVVFLGGGTAAPHGRAGARAAEPARGAVGMSLERQQLEAGIAALEAQRALLGDAVVDAMLAPARARLAALQAAEPPAQVLKQVTILFLDVVGSTTLSQHLDPEAIGELMDGALARGTRVVEAHQGRVLQYAGDNILAAFGADGAREDDAERTVSCGLALLALGRTLGEEVRVRYGHAGFGVRVGAHTGPVLLGGGVDAEGSIRGIAVNIAARMEQTAPPGALRISHDTYAQVRGMFEVEPQPPLAVKGVDVPVHSVLVLRAKPRSFRIGTRGIEGVSTRMVGRQAELQALQAAFHRLCAQPRLAAVTVVADAGLGKSRLLYEFEAWSDAQPEGFVLFRGRAAPQTGAQAFGLLRDLLAWRFQLQDDDGLERARRKLEDGLVPLFATHEDADQAQAHVHLLGHLVGIDWRDSPHLKGLLEDARQIRRRGLHAAGLMFRRMAAREGRPVIVQLEDLHWADDETLQFLDSLADTHHDVPMLLLAFTRPTLFERWPTWRCGTAGQDRIDLAPLGPEWSGALADELLKRLPEVPTALRQLLIGSAEGNPYYMEELVRMLIDQGAIRTQDEAAGHWSVDVERLRLTQVPATLTGVLQSRLDALPPPERRALQLASVVGAVFWDDALAAVDADAASQLPALVGRELVLPRADAPLEGLREYAFRHHLLYQVVYDTVLKRHKRDAHARVARWLAGAAGQGGARASELPGQAAEHFERAGDPANACEQHARAAEQAWARLAHERVLLHTQRALALLDDLPADDAEARRAQAELRWRLVGVRCDTLDMQARRDEEAADLDTMDALADALGDDRRRAEVARRRSLRASRMADWALMGLTARHGAACATRAGDDTLRLLNLRLVAASEVISGRNEAGEAIAQQVLAEARRLKLHQVEARALNTLSIAAERRGDLVAGLEANRQSYLLHKNAGERVLAAVCLSNLGGARGYVGDLDQARADLDEALTQLRALGHHAMESAALCTLSTLAVWGGDALKARALAQQARTLSEAGQGRDVLVWSYLREAEAELALGRLGEARQAFDQAHGHAVAIEASWQHEASAGLARVALAQGDVRAALAALQPVLAHFDQGGSDDGVEFPRLLELTCHRALASAGDPRAPEWLTRAHEAMMRQAAVLGQGAGGQARRQAYLENIPHHRDIVAARAAWADRAAPGGPD